MQIRTTLLTGLLAATALLSALAIVGVVFAGDTSAPEDANLYIVSPADGAIVTSPVHVVFGLQNMGVAPSGVQHPHTGHHHLLIDTDLPAMDKPIPSDEHHIHFGGGQTETTIELSPGKHTLQLILGDYKHVPFNPPVVSKKITITVVADK